LSNKKTWQPRIRHMLDEILTVHTYLDGKSQEELIRDPVLIRALERSIEVISEAATHIPVEVKELYPDIPWRLMIGMRNKLIHDYDDVDGDMLWLTAINDLPALAELIKKIDLKE
jgi:uncharacterized protein with HEPN domain